MKYIDLFSGIGGFALGARWAGLEWEEHYFSEINPFAIKQYQRNFPDAVNLGDIKNINVEDIKQDGKSIWVVSGGFPCQPFSNAGKRGGEADDRYLWPYVLKFIDDFKPAWILLENVTGIISMGLDKMLSQLEHLGYTNRDNGEPWIDPIVIPACAVNAPHRRDRLFIIAYSPEKRWNSQLHINQVLQPATTQKTNWVDTQGNPFLQFTERSGEPAIFGVDDGVPSWVDKDYKLGLETIGEAVVPQIACYLFQIIKALSLTRRI